MSSLVKSEDSNEFSLHMDPFALVESFDHDNVLFAIEECPLDAFEWKSSRGNHRIYEKLYYHVYMLHALNFS